MFFDRSTGDLSPCPAEHHRLTRRTPTLIHEDARNDGEGRDDKPDADSFAESAIVLGLQVRLLRRLWARWRTSLCLLSRCLGSRLARSRGSAGAVRARGRAEALLEEAAHVQLVLELLQFGGPFQTSGHVPGLVAFRCGENSPHRFLAIVLLHCEHPGLESHLKHQLLTDDILRVGRLWLFELGVWQRPDQLLRALCELFVLAQPRNLLGIR